MAAHHLPKGSANPARSATDRCGSPRYQWLLFDADGTLFDYDRAETAALRAAFQEIGAAFDPGYVATYRRINQALWQALERGEVKPDALKVRRFELLLEAIGVAYPAAALSEIYLRCLADCSELVEGAEEVLSALHGQCQAAIVTNGLQAVQRRRVARSSIRDRIAHLIISEEIGCAKPAREYFDITFARLGHPPKNRVLMVGDSWFSDMQGAADYGIDTCWFNPRRLARPATPAITCEITSLRELIPLCCPDGLTGAPQSVASPL
jgi:2-haloacid dehalogenase